MVSVMSVTAPPTAVSGYSTHLFLLRDARVMFTDEISSGRLAQEGFDE